MAGRLSRGDDSSARGPLDRLRLPSAPARVHARRRLPGIRAPRLARRSGDDELRREGRRARGRQARPGRPGAARRGDRRPLDRRGHRDREARGSQRVRRPDGPAGLRVPDRRARDRRALLRRHRRDAPALHALQQSARLRHRRAPRRARGSRSPASEPGGREGVERRRPPGGGDPGAHGGADRDLRGCRRSDRRGRRRRSRRLGRRARERAARGVRAALRPRRGGPDAGGPRPLRVVPSPLAPRRRAEVRAAHQAHPAGDRNGLGARASAASETRREGTRRGAGPDPGAPRREAAGSEKLRGSPTCRRPRAPACCRASRGGRAS